MGVFFNSIGNHTLSNSISSSASGDMAHGKIVAQGTSWLGELPAAFKAGCRCLFPLTTAVPQETITCIVEHVYFTGWTSVVFYGPGVLNIKLYPWHWLNSPLHDAAGHTIWAVFWICGCSHESTEHGNCPKGSNSSYDKCELDQSSHAVLDHIWCVKI